MPEDVVTVRSRQHKVSYRQWIEQGLVTPTSGNYTSTDEMVARFEADADVFEVERLGGDMAFAKEFLNRMDAKGFSVESVRQNYSLHPAIKKVRTLVKQGRMRHGGNKVMDWMMSNVALKRNAGGQAMIDKSDRITGKGKDHKRGRKKVDGPVVLVMCLSMYLDTLKTPEVKAEDIVSWF